MDTSFTMSWAGFLKVIERNGFKIIIKRRFEYAFGDKKPDRPEFIIAAHPDKYLLLSATSFVSESGESLNGGNVYGTLFGSDSTKSWNALNGCSFAPKVDHRCEFSYDVRTGLIFKLNELGNNLQFIKWNDPNRFLWLLDYAQEKKDSDNWKGIRDEFVSEAPDWVRNFITTE